jgi:ABC-type Fe3+ transport system permease subunit
MVANVVMVSNYIDDTKQRLTTTGKQIIGRFPDSVTDSKAAIESVAFNAGLVLGFALVAVPAALYFFSEPAAAQSGGGGSTSGICSNDLMGFVRNATGALVVVAPSIGFANAGWNFSKAAGTNKSNKKKEAKENIRSSIMYGIAGGMMSAIVALLTTWGPFSYCSF